MTYINVFHLGNKHQQLLRLVNFYEKEIEMLRKLLTENLNKHPAHKSMADAEHFQNQFIVQQNNIDELRHNINVNKFLVFRDAKYHSGKVEDVLIDENVKIEKQVLEFEKSVMELRQDFKKYLLKYL